MMQHAQESFATILQTAWEQTQLVRGETGISVELRLTTLGLTALSGDFLCSRMATVTWRELAQEADLPARLGRAIRDVADRPRPNLMSIGRDRSAPEAIVIPRDASRAPARARQAAGGRPGMGRAKVAKRNRKQSQI